MNYITLPSVLSNFELFFLKNLNKDIYSSQPSIDRLYTLVHLCCIFIHKRRRFLCGVHSEIELDSDNGLVGGLMVLCQ